MLRLCEIYDILIKKIVYAKINSCTFLNARMSLKTQKEYNKIKRNFTSSLLSEKEAWRRSKNVVSGHHPPSFASTCAVMKYKKEILRTLTITVREMLHTCIRILKYSNIDTWQDYLSKKCK